MTDAERLQQCRDILDSGAPEPDKLKAIYAAVSPRVMQRAWWLPNRFSADHNPPMGS